MLKTTNKIFFENRGKQTCQTIKNLNKEDPAKFFVATRPLVSAEKIYIKYEYFAFEILEERQIFCADSR